jgi:hypothetical protein
MIRKVALVQALREAFPEDFGGMYSPEEMPVDTQTLPDNPVSLNGNIREQSDYDNQEKSRLDQVIPFGKHQGRKLGDLIQNEHGYCEWMAKSGNEKWSPVFQQLLEEASKVTPPPADAETGEVKDTGDIPPAVLKMAEKAGMNNDDLLAFIADKYDMEWSELTGNAKSEITKHLHDLGQTA